MSIGIPEIILIVVVVLLLFGAPTYLLFEAGLLAARRFKGRSSENKED